MGFCLLFGWKRREGVISSQSVSSFHCALQCTFSRQCFNKKRDRVEDDLRSGKAKVWCYDRGCCRTGWWTGCGRSGCGFPAHINQSESGIVGLKFTESPKRETLHMHFEFYLSEVKRVFFWGGGVRRTFFCREAAALSALPRCSAHTHLCSVLKPYSCCVQLKKRKQKTKLHNSTQFVF